MPRKSFNVLQTESLILKSGDFIDATGKQVTLTDDIVVKIYDNVESAVPIYFKHSGDRIPKGYATVFEQNDDVFTFGGHIYENDTLKRISFDGFSDVSAEVDLECDADGNVINGKLTGIAVVKKGLIGGSSLVTQAVAFGDDGKGTPEPQSDNQIASLIAERDQYKALYEGTLKEQLTGLCTNLVEKGVQDPMKIVEGIPVAQQLSILKNLKDNIIVKQPASAPAPEGEHQKQTPEKLKMQALGELGISPEFYKEVMTK